MPSLNNLNFYCVFYSLLSKEHSNISIVLYASNFNNVSSKITAKINDLSNAGV